MRFEHTTRMNPHNPMNGLLDRGCYSIPHVIDDLDLTAKEKAVMFALLKFESVYCQKRRKSATSNQKFWFYSTGLQIARVACCSKTHLASVRRLLKSKGLIDYVPGKWWLAKATQYRILIDPFYLIENSMK